jgi:hypothetical protein
MLDDFFLIHEAVFPNHLGLSSNMLFLAYGVITFGLLLHYRKVIYQTDYVFILMSLFFFAGSIVVDQLHDYGLLVLLGTNSDGFQYFLEDSFKLLGITGWFSYFVLVCHATLTQVIGIESVSKVTGR